MPYYIVTSINASVASSDTDLQKWLNEHAEKGFRLFSITRIIDNGRDFIHVVMEHIKPPAPTQEKAS